MITQEEIKALEDIVGSQWVRTEPCMMDTYSFYMNPELLNKDGGRFAPRPVAVVMPGSTEEVQALVRYCNTSDLMVKPISTGFGTWAAASRDRVIILDLKRMNRIIDIDVKNQVAIIEPYVRAIDLQTILFKHGLNVHVVSCGGSHSILASTAAFCGYGVTGPTLGFSGRNLLGVEWVLPTGEVLNLGSGGMGAGWFTADGPGPSLRGVLRGFMGTCGALGVITKCAVKLYHWEGPKELAVAGKSSNYHLTHDLPKMSLNLMSFSKMDDMREAGYRLGEAGIEYSSFRVPMFFAAVGNTENNQELKFAMESGVPQLFFNYALANVVIGFSQGEFEWKQKVLLEILKELNGALMPMNLAPTPALYKLLKSAGSRMKDPLALFRNYPFVQKLVRSIPFGKETERNMRSRMFWLLLRNAINTQGTFRPSQGMGTTLGSFDTWDMGIAQSDWIAEAKSKYIKKGLVLDDGGDLGCGGTFEAGHMGYLEGIVLYNSKEPQSTIAARELVEDGVRAAKDVPLGLPIAAYGADMNAFFGPSCRNYHQWQNKIKTALDPNTASDPFFYADPAKE